MVLVLTLMAVAVIWILAKVIKWTLHLLLWLVLVGGVAAALWLLLHQGITTACHV